MSNKELLQHPMLKYDKRIYDEALELSINREKLRYTLEPKVIEIRVHYVTNFGQEVYIVGSSNLLGRWDGNSKGKQLYWSEGHIWKIQFQKTELEDNFEFKFVIKSDNHLIRWEEGKNHVYDYNKFHQMLSQPNVLKQIQESNYDNVEIVTDQVKIGFDRKAKCLILQTYWQV